MKSFSIPSGTPVYVGKPANPMDTTCQAAITQLVNQLHAVHEAHLPQCYSPGVIDPPSQILAVVIDPAQSQETVIQELLEGLAKILPAGVHIEVLPLTSQSPILQDVRNSDCQVKGSAR